MGRTRSSKPVAGDDSEPAAPGSSSKYTLGPRKELPAQLFIIPDAVTHNARIVTLPHPRSGQPSRYLVCPESGIHEFTNVSPPKSTPSSWLINRAAPDKSGSPHEKTKDCADVVMAGAMYVATSIDPIFLVLPALADGRIEKGSDETKRMFITSDDHFDKLPEESSHLNEILRWEPTRTLIESRMESICDTVDAGDEKMFRLNEQKFFATILSKAKRMSSNGLPSSLDEKFVQKALEAPVLLQKTIKKPAEAPVASGGTDSAVSTPRTDSAMSQSTASTADSASSFASQPSTAATSFVEESPGDEEPITGTRPSSDVLDLQRLRVAFDFICSKYIPMDQATQLQQRLKEKDTSNVDFTPLDTYLAKLTALRAEAMAANSMADYSRKRGRDEEEDEMRAEKKRKLEEEKRRKANESRGVRDLKKVNTSGMLKLSHFFKAK